LYEGRNTRYLERYFPLCCTQYFFAMYDYHNETESIFRSTIQTLKRVESLWYVGM